MPHTRRRSLHGFTLVELLVVLAIIAVLISLLIPGLKKAKEITWRVICASNLKQFGYIELTYAADNNGVFIARPYPYEWEYNVPDVRGGPWWKPFDVRPQLLEYGQQGRLFYCPSKWSASMNSKLPLFEDLGQYFGQLEIDYFLYVGNAWPISWKSPRQMYRIREESDVQLPGDQVMSSDFAHNHVQFSSIGIYAPYYQPLRPLRGNHTLSRGGDFPIQGGNRLYHDGHVVFMHKDAIELAATQTNNMAMWFW